MDTAPPPVYEGDISGIHYFKWHCMNRHNRFINGVFVDSSVKKIGLKQLWTFLWHRGYKKANPWTIIFYEGDKAACAKFWDNPRTGALWMKDFKEY